MFELKILIIYAKYIQNFWWFEGNLVFLENQYLLILQKNLNKVLIQNNYKLTDNLAISMLVAVEWFFIENGIIIHHLKIIKVLLIVSFYPSIIGEASWGKKT